MKWAMRSQQGGWLIIGTPKNWWCSTLGRTTVERHGDFLRHLENSRSNDPWAKKNMAFKALTPVSPHSSCQFIVTSYIVFTYVDICHNIMLITRSYIKQRLQTEQRNIFRNTILSQIKLQMHTLIIIQRLTTSASVSDTPQQGAHTSCHFRSNEKVRWLEPRHSCRLLKLSKGTCRRTKNLGIWCARLRTSNAKGGWMWEM